MSEQTQPDPTPDADGATEAAATEAAELRALAEATARDASNYLTSITEVASGASPETAIPILLLALSDVVAAGSRLGAMQDVVPSEQFEPDSGPEGDADPLRDGLANLLGDLDEYVCVADPLRDDGVTSGSISSDLADIALALTHGLAHYQDGRLDEALWWWQFSFLSSMGDQALLALRAITSILSHVRLDADDELVGEAEFDALHP